MDRGEWRAAIHGVAKSRTRVRDGNNKLSKSVFSSLVSGIIRPLLWNLGNINKYVLNVWLIMWLMLRLIVWFT